MWARTVRSATIVANMETRQDNLLRKVEAVMEELGTKYSPIVDAAVEAADGIWENFLLALRTSFHITASPLEKFNFTFST